MVQVNIGTKSRLHDSPHAIFENPPSAIIAVVLCVAARVVIMILVAVAGACHLNAGTKAADNHIQTPCTVVDAHRVLPNPAHMTDMGILRTVTFPEMSFRTNEIEAELEWQRHRGL